MVKKVTRAGAIGNFIEFYDFTLYGFFAVVIARLFFPAFDTVAALLSTFAVTGVAFVVRPLGALVFGHIGDRWGRKRALLISVMLMSGSTACIGLLPTYASIGVFAPLLLLVFRLAQGFSAGGEQTGAFVLVVEGSPIERRGANASRLLMAVIAGVIVAASSAVTVNLLTTPEQLDSWGWRIPFLLAVPLGVLGIYLRRNIEDSAEYRRAAQSSTAQAEKLPVARAFRAVKKQMLILFGWVSMQSVIGYILTVFMLSYLVVTEGYSMITALIVMIAGHAIALVLLPLMGALADRINRRRFSSMLAAAMVIWILPAFLLLQQNVATAIIAIGTVALINYSMMLVSAMAVVDLFPVAFRYTASALPFQMAYVVFGGFAPVMATWMTANISTVAPAYYVMVLAVAGFVLAATSMPGARDDSAEATPNSPSEPGNTEGTAPEGLRTP